MSTHTCSYRYNSTTLHISAHFTGTRLYVHVHELHIHPQHTCTHIHRKDMHGMCVYIYKKVWRGREREREGEVEGGREGEREEGGGRGRERGGGDRSDKLTEVIYMSRV